MDTKELMRLIRGVVEPGDLGDLQISCAWLLSLQIPVSLLYIGDPLVNVFA